MTGLTDPCNTLACSIVVTWHLHDTKLDGYRYRGLVGAIFYVQTKAVVSKHISGLCEFYDMSEPGELCSRMGEGVCKVVSAWHHRRLPKKT